MSAPIGIPRASSATASSSASSPSPTGVYIPVHKRVASSLQSQHEVPLVLPPLVRGSPRSTSSLVLAPPSAHCAPALIPTGSHIPCVYSIPDLLALAGSPLARISPAQREHIERTLPLVSSSTAHSPMAASRRRRLGRKTGVAKFASSAGEDVESRRRRHGAWGWHAEGAEVAGPPPMELSWRHAPLRVAAVAAC